MRRATLVAAWAATLLILGAAIAGAAGDNPVGAGKDLRPETPPAHALEAQANAGAESEASEASGDNHGACVSHWVHEARDQDLHGRFFGGFVSEVAQSDETGDDCDFSGALSDALDVQEAEPEHGNASGEHGNSAEAPGRATARGSSGDHRKDGS